MCVRRDENDEKWFWWKTSTEFKRNYSTAPWNWVKTGGTLRTRRIQLSIKNSYCFLKSQSNHKQQNDFLEINALNNKQFYHLSYHNWSGVSITNGIEVVTIWWNRFKCAYLCVAKCSILIRNRMEFFNLPEQSKSFSYFSLSACRYFWNTAVSTIHSMNPIRKSFVKRRSHSNANNHCTSCFFCWMCWTSM